MRPIAVLVDIDTPTVDSVILWQEDDQLVAYAYQNANVTRRQVLTPGLFDDQIAEVRAVFDIRDARITWIQVWMPA